MATQRPASPGMKKSVALSDESMNSKQQTQTLIWLDQLKAGLWDFLNDMQADNCSYFNYSKSGDLYSRTSGWGLANIVFALRVLFVTGLIDRLSPRQKDNLYQGIIEHSKPDGYINDSLITSRTLREKLRQLYSQIRNGTTSAFRKNEILKTRRAETRQSFAALHLLGRTPLIPLVEIPSSKREVHAYLEGLDWSKPWAAASHFSHLLFFLRMNSEFFPSVSNGTGESLISYAVDWINGIQHEKDGCWYVGETVPLYQSINGAMKVLNGMHVAKIEEIRFVRSLIDTALSAVNDEHACNHFNLTYVLYGATRIEKDYRFGEIERFLLDRLSMYRDYYWPDHGGFSFHKGLANDSFYGKKITRGFPEPDIHGTAMFVWGIVLIDTILHLGLGWKVPLN